MAGKQIPDDIWSEHMARGTFIATVVLAAVFLGVVVAFILLR